MRNFDLEQCALELYRQPWAILPEKLTALVRVFERRRAGMELDKEEIESIKAERVKASVVRGQTRDLECGLSAHMVGRVAILPLHGVIVQRPGMFTRYSGGASAEQFTAAHAELANDSNVKAIVWDVHSPGGSVYGVEEAHSRLMTMRGKKKTVAYVNTVMASAAYYLGCCADEIVGSPSSVAGNIGVIMIHEDKSKQDEMLGINVTYVYAGKYKAEGWVPLDDEATKAMQTEVDAYYDQFVSAVAKARGVNEKAVRNGMGEGRALTAKLAQTAGIIDRIDTIEGVLDRLGAYDNATGKKNTMSAAETRIRLAHAQGR